jgi:hypothetical protein
VSRPGRVLLGLGVALLLAAACKRGSASQRRAREAATRTRVDAARLAEEADRLAEDHLDRADHHEARGWLADPSHGVGSGGKERVVAVVEELYRQGARDVRVTDVETRDGKPLARSLVVVLPDDRAARARILGAVGEFRRARGQAPVPDAGQRHLLLTVE